MLTRSGLGVAVAAVVLGGAGWWWGYEEIVAVAVVALGLLVAAIWVSQRPLRATIDRHLRTVRVPRGDPIQVAYRVRNPHRARTARATIIDRCDDIEGRADVASVPPDSEVVVGGLITTRRRGVFDVGPLDVERVDPFLLTVGRRRIPLYSTVTVHPKIYDLIGPHGAVRVVESESTLRRATSDPMSGFVSMRQYVDGDDPRLIHWPTTARTGTLMVREHVEVRRPEFAVVLDAASNIGTDDDFEESVDVAATLAVHAIRSGLDVVVRTTHRDFSGHPGALVDDGAVLDLLTPVTRADESQLIAVASLFTGGFDHASVVFVTGPHGPSSRFVTTERVSVIRIGHGARAGADALFAADDAKDFVQRWRTSS